LAFSALLGLGLAWFAVVWTRRRDQAQRVGTFSLARESTTEDVIDVTDAAAAPASPA